MNSSMIQIVILAGVALFLVLQLRKVLGTRDGFEPPKSEGVEGPANGAARNFDVIDGGGEDHDIAHFIGVDTSDGKALSACPTMSMPASPERLMRAKSRA